MKTAVAGICVPVTADSKLFLPEISVHILNIRFKNARRFDMLSSVILDFKRKSYP